MITLKKFSTIVFCISYTLFLTFSFMGHIPVLGEYLDIFSNVGVVILVAFSFFLYFHDRTIKKREFVILVAVLAFSIIIAYKSTYFGLFKLILIIAATRKIDYEKCLKFDIFLRTVLMLALYFLYSVGIAPDEISIYNGEIRHSYGFQNCNHVGMSVFIIVLELLYLNRDRFKWYIYAICIGLLLYCDVSSKSRTAELFIVIAMLAFLLYHLAPSTYKLRSVRAIISVAAPVFAILTFVMWRLYNNGNRTIILVDTFLSGRIDSVNFFMKLIGSSLLGNDISIGERTLDNCYAYMWISLGAIAFVFFIICYMRMIKVMYEKNNIAMVLILLMFAAYGLSERLWMNVDYNILMLAFRELVFYEPEEYDAFEEEHVLALEQGEN